VVARGRGGGATCNVAMLIIVEDDMCNYWQGRLTVQRVSSSQLSKLLSLAELHVRAVRQARPSHADKNAVLPARVLLLTA
jgi:hypothetical protein